MNKKFICIIIILILLNFVLVTPALAGVDESIRNIVRETDEGLLDESMHYITYLGDGRVNFILASMIPDEGARLDAHRSILLSGVGVLMLKSIIGKKRPPGPIEYQPFTLSSRYHAFPSGHTTTAFALATSISYHYPEYNKLAYTLATLVGISRLYEDKHWFSDIVAGAGLGYISARIVEYKW
ncbi:MAG: phosphatase PAP2 family protein [Bacillota bacterium]